MFGSSSSLPLSLILAAALAASPAPPGAPKAIYEPVPAVEAAAVRNPHDRDGKLFCQRCHVPEGQLREPASTLCRGCHKQPRDNHPVQIVQKTPPRDASIPLSDGMVTCVSCHDPHDRRARLRLPARQLCPVCHPAK